MQASLAGARQQLNANLAQISGTTVEHIRRFSSRSRDARCLAAMRRTYIKVPVAGVVASRVVQVRQHAAAGTGSAFALLPAQYGSWLTFA